MKLVSRQVRAALLLVGLGQLAGCTDRIVTACDGRAGAVLRLHVLDAAELRPIGNPGVTATIVGQPGQPVVIVRPPADSTVTEVRGAGGLYEVTVAKPGYVSATKRVTIEGASGCAAPEPTDFTISVTRAP